MPEKWSARHRTGRGARGGWNKTIRSENKLKKCKLIGGRM